MLTDLLSEDPSNMGVRGVHGQKEDRSTKGAGQGYGRTMVALVAANEEDMW